MSRRESRLSTGRTNRSASALSMRDDEPGLWRESPSRGRNEGRFLSAAMETLRLTPGVADGGRRARSSLGGAGETRMSISAGKSAHGKDPANGDTMHQPPFSSQHRQMALDDDNKMLDSLKRSPAATPSPHTRLRGERGGLDIYQQRPETELREKFLEPPLTPNAALKARLAKIRGNYSPELKQLQLQLMSDQGRPFSALQKALVFSKDDAEPDAKLKMAIVAATNQGTEPSDALVKELRTLTKATPGQQVEYDQLLQVVWDDNYMSAHKVPTKPGRGNVLKYLYLVGSPAGCYNDNIEPKPSLFGVKKGSSSVRYSLFTNENVDMSSTFKLVPSEMIRAVDAGMKMCIAKHPVTGRPLDPVLSYLAVSQGKKCDMRPSDQPLDILKLTQKTGYTREWDCLPNLSFGFTKMHKGEWRLAERRNLIM